MSTKPPPSKSGKPFLGEDDLESELDAWDATFDALHGGPEGEMAQWGAPDPTTVSPPAPDDPSSMVEADDALHTLDFDPGADEPQMTLDDAVGWGAPEPEPPSAYPRALSFTAVDTVAPEDETDFSDVGAGRPAAMGELLGRAASAPPIAMPVAMADDEAAIDARDVEPTQIRDSGAVYRLPSNLPEEDDDEIFTSASRPRRAPSDFEAPIDDDVAPPPAPSRPHMVAPSPSKTPTTPPSGRTGPAIVRRTPVSMPAVTPADLDPVHSEHTRIQLVDELEAVIDLAREAVAQSEDEPQIALDEDAYDDIEIDAAAPPPEPEPSRDVSRMSELPERRRTAHVVRREVPTRPPPQHHPMPTHDVIEMDIDDELPAGGDRALRPTAPPPPASEDDFSDVAAAVGADDDLPPVELAIGGAPTAQPALDLDAILGDEVLPDADAPLRHGHADLIVGHPDPVIPAPAPRTSGEHTETRTVLERPASDRPPAMLDLYPRVKTPTSVPPLGIRTMPGVVVPRPPETTPPPGAAPPRARLQTPLPVAPEIAEYPAEREPELLLDSVARDWPEQVAPLPSAMLDEHAASALLVYEREVATLDDSETSAALRIEAGRLCERLADLDRARHHYDAALLSDPRATAALRGLRRIARSSGDLDEATAHLDTEIAVAGALERRPLSHYRIDLLLASGEQDLARVAVGEILDQAPSDIRALLAQLELAFLDGRADEFGNALEQIAHAVTDNQLRAAVQVARGVLAAHHNDAAAATSWFAAAVESDPSALAARLGAVRQAAAQADGLGAAHALVDVARQVAETDGVTAAAAAVRAQQWLSLAPAPSEADHAVHAELASAAAGLAAAAAPEDPLVARLSAETLETADARAAAPAFAEWARVARSPEERAYAAARAAELGAPGVASWSIVLEHDPDDDYAAAQLRTAHVAAEATDAAIAVDLALATDPTRERARLRAAYGMIAQGRLDEAITVLRTGREHRPHAISLAEALGEALAAAGQWRERAMLFAEIAREPGELHDPDLALLRSAIAWEEAVGAAAQVDAGEASDATSAALQSATAEALDAWERVLEHSIDNPTAHAATISLATRMGDRAVLGEVLARAQTAERVPLAAASLAFRRARLIAQESDAELAEALLRDIQPVDDPRRTVALVMAAARANELGDAAAALEGRAQQLDEASAKNEVAALRLRAAQLALDAGDASRATRLLQQVEQTLPTLGAISDLLAAARRRAGERPTVGVRRGKQEAAAPDAFARLVRDGDFAVVQGDHAAALALYQRALELRPGDPLARIPLVRTAIELREPAPLAGMALAQLRAAEDAGDELAKATAYELLAQIDGDLRDDRGAAQISLESAWQADPSRIDLMHRLEQHYTLNDEIDELLRLRAAEVAAVPVELAKERAALQLDITGLATRDHRPELEVAELYRTVLASDPGTRLALLHLESIVRGLGASEELAGLEEKIAEYFEGDPKTQATFWTRAGETFAELGKIDEAVQRFGRAEAALPGHVPALEGWRQAALKGELWVDVAEAAQRQAVNASDPQHAARLYHFAGVALMDKALVGEQAMSAFRRALDADPTHRDAFLRLRILLEEDANHDDLAVLLANRLEVEDELAPRIELHRALAELHRNFLSDRDTATRHFRAILDYDPNDLRSHAAVADIAWEQGNWQDAADALMARARLEREPEILKTLCFRLGLIYADRLVDIPMALKAFQRALTYQPDDENTLIRLADLAAQIGEWKLALGACERLVKNEGDPDRRVAHLHRVAKIFKDGFGDTKRAERALNLALDSSPTNDDALQRLVQFYKDARDIQSVRVHLNRVAGAMRARVQKTPLDGVPYRVIARAMSARAQTGVPGSLPIARAAAQLADLLGAAGEPEATLLREPPRPDLSQLARPEADEVLFPRSVQLELRQVFQLLGDRVAKHVGVNVQAYGVSRGDRVRAKDNPVAAVAQSVASALAFGDIDVYISSRQPWVMIAEPTSPVSLVIGTSVANAGGDAIRFAAGGALKLAQASLAIPARMPVDELGVLVTALLRLFQPDFPVHHIDAEAVGVQYNKLRRLIPTGLMNELRPFALAVDPQRYNHQELARDLRVAGLRAGLAASGSLLAGLHILAAQADAELPGFLADPLAQGLVSFALSEDHAAVARYA